MRSEGRLSAPSVLGFSSKMCFASYLNFAFAITLRIRERFFGFLGAADTTKILAKQVVGPADIALHFFGMLHQTDVLLQGWDREGDAIGFGVGFSEIEVRSSLAGIQAYRVPESHFCSGKVAQSHRRNPQQHQKVILIGIDLQLVFELLARLRIGLLAELLEIGVTEESVRTQRYFGSSLMALRSSAMAGSWEVRHRVGPPE